MALTASKIPLGVRRLSSMRAQVDRNRIETVKIDRSAPLELTEEQLVMLCREAEKKPKATADQIPPFVKVFQDEACSKCLADDKAGIPENWRHLPWDEVELKKHNLLDTQCEHIADIPWLDEIEMKKLGMIDSECNRAPPDLDESEKRKAAELGNKVRQQLQMASNGNASAPGRHIKISSVVEDIDDLTPTGPSLSSTSSAVILTAHPSSSSQAGVSQQPSEPGSSVLEQKASQKAAETPETKPAMNVAIVATPEMLNTSDPIVMTKTIDTADGRFDFSISFEVRFTPKKEKMRSAE